MAPDWPLKLAVDIALNVIPRLMSRLYPHL